MKKALLVLSLGILALGKLVAQSITVTSFDTNPAEVNDDFTVNIEYTTSNANDIIYLGLELKNSDGSWAATIAEAFINPVGLSGADVDTSAIITVPSGTIPSADLSGGQYYDLKVELNAEGWTGWLAGDYPGITLVAEGTLSLKSSRIDKLKAYPNPTFDRLSIVGIDNEKITNVEINNLYGETVYRDIDFEKRYIDVSTLSTGIYLLSIRDNKKVSYIKFVKH